MAGFSRKLLLACGGAATSLAWASIASAQGVDAAKAEAANSGGRSGDIVVTAQRRTERVNDIPFSITAATGDDLKKLGITTVGDLQKVVPGFRFAESNYGPPVYAIRGIGFNDGSLGAKPTVALSLDDAPLPFASMARAGATMDLDRVEVLKGPQGTLYGQNATAGAVNYIAAKPTKTFKAGGDVSYARFDDVTVNGFVSGPVTDTVRARIAVSVEDAGPWQQSYTRNDTNGKINKKAARLLLDWDAAENLRFQVNLNGSIDKSDSTALQYVAATPSNPANAAIYAPLLLTYPLPPKDPRAADWGAADPLGQNIKNYQGILRGEYDLSPEITLTSVSSYSGMDIFRPFDADGTQYQLNYNTVDGRLRVFSQELRLAGEYDRFRWITGVSYEHDKTRERDQQYYAYTIGGNALNAFQPDGQSFNQSGNLGISKFETMAAFASANFEILPDVNVNGGIRYTDVKLDFQGCSLNGADGRVGTAIGGLGNFLRGAVLGLPPAPIAGPGECVTLDENFAQNIVTNELNENNVSWKAGLDWKPLSDTLLYGYVSKGYKGGSFPTITAVQADEYDPVVQESVVTYEVGFKSRIVEALQLNGAIFYYDYTNKQVYGRVPVIAFGNLPALVNVPKSRIQGAELSATLTPFAGLSLTGSATYVDSKIKGDFINSDQFGQTWNFGGEPFPLTSKWQATFDAEYETPINDKYTVFVGGTASYLSSTYGGLGQGTIGQPTTETGAPSNNWTQYLRMPAYTLVDLRAGTETADGAWRFSVWGRNVTDKLYSNQTNSMGDLVIRHPGRPATYGVTLTARLQ